MSATLLSSRFYPTVMVLLATSLLACPSLAQDTPDVEGVEVGQQPLIEQVPLTGSVSADRIAQLSTAVKGLVRQLLVDTGDEVKAGDLLLSLDTSPATSLVLEWAEKRQSSKKATPG